MRGPHEEFTLSRSLFLALCAFTASTHTAIAQTFEVTNTIPISGAPGLPSGTWGWTVTGVNSSGVVVGSAWGDYSRAPFAWSASGAAPLGLPPGYIAASPNALNASGWPAGTSYTDFGHGTPTVWMNGTVTTIPVPGQIDSEVTAINGLGHVAGITGLDQPGTVRGFVWNDGSFTNLPSLGLAGAGQAGPQALNNAGVVVGYSEVSAGSLTATRWVNGVPQSLGVAGDFSSARAVNEDGTIVGIVNDGRGFIIRNGEIEYLAQSGAVGVQPRSLNASGDVVGTIFYQDPSNRTEAFLYSNGQWHTGSELIGVPGAVQSEAPSVTDDGRIFILGYDSQFRQTVYELSPTEGPPSGDNGGNSPGGPPGVPEPATGLLLGLAAIGAAGWRRVRG